MQDHGRCSDDRPSRAAFLLRVIRLHFPSDRDVRILDLGCGAGTLMHFLREAGYTRVTGIDSSPEQVAAAGSIAIPGVERGDILPFVRGLDEGSVDVVVTWDVIEHLTKGELAPLSDDVFRILSPRGRWIIHAPNAESPFGSRIRYADWTHEQAFTRESLGQLLRAAGFAHVGCFEDTPVVQSAEGLCRWVAWKAIRGFLRVWVRAETGDTGRDSIFTQNLLAVATKD
jgi:SAM-dependent methyltransferase